MGRLIDIRKVAEDDNTVAYSYHATNERAGLVVVDKINRDFQHAVSSEMHKTYFAVRHKLKQCLDADEFPEKLIYASG